MNGTQIFVTVVVALIAIVPSFLAFRSSESTKRVLADQKTKQDATNALDRAYERAQRINQEIVEGLREEITRLQSELTGVRQEMMTTAHRNLELERLVTTLERSVSRMSAMLAQYGVDLTSLEHEVK
jgi:hypothetical protein